MFCATKLKFATINSSNAKVNVRIKVAIKENLQEGRIISNILLSLEEPKDQAASSRFFGICDILFERFNIANGITKIDCPIATKNNDGS